MIDVLAHFIYSLAVLAPAAKGHIWFSAILLGLFREVEQMRLAGDWDLGQRRLVDIAGFAAAGLVLQLWGKP